MGARGGGPQHSVPKETGGVFSPGFGNGEGARNFRGFKGGRGLEENSSNAATRTEFQEKSGLFPPGFCKWEGGPGQLVVLRGAAGWKKIANAATPPFYK